MDNSKNGVGITLLENRKRKIYVVKYEDTFSFGWKTNDDKEPVLGAYIEFTNKEVEEIIKYIVKSNGGK